MKIEEEKMFNEFDDEFMLTTPFTIIEKPNFYKLTS